MKLNAKKMGSIKTLKDSLKKGASGNGLTYIKGVPNDGITVRFLTEPEDWFGYYEYFDAEAKSFVPMAEGEVLPDGAKPSFRYLANALDVSSDRVVPLKLAKTAANILILKYDKFDTMMDRNYELQKHGEGLDTTYDVTPDGPSKMNLAKYTLLDLEKVLLDARALATGETLDPTPTAPVDDDDDEDEDTKPTPAKATTKPASKPKFTDDQLFPDNEYRTDYSKDELEFMSSEDLAGLIDWWGEDGYELGDGSDEIESVLEWQRDFADGEEDSDDEEEDSDDDDDEDDEDGEEVEYDEDALLAMSIRELRLIAADLEITPDKGATKQQIVDLIIEAAEA